MSRPRPTLAEGLYRIVVACLLALIALTVLIGVVMVALGYDSDLAGRVFGSACLYVLAFGVFVAAGTVLRRRRVRPAMVISIASTIIGTTGAFLVIWYESTLTWSTQERVIQIAITLLILGVALAHTGIFSLIRTHSRLLFWVKNATTVCLWSAATAVVLMFWLGDLIGSTTAFMVLMMTTGLLSLATLVGTVVVPLAAVSQANRESDPVESVASRLTIRLECPDCGTRQTLGTGAVRCVSCRATLLIEVEEPRCKCGYLLYRLVGDQCPECGRAIPPEERWAGPESPETPAAVAGEKSAPNPEP